MALSIEDLDDAAHGEQPSVLVVDDSERVADLYTSFLEDAYDVTTVYSGEAALDVVDDSHDVVLLDRRMPALPGDDVLEGIRNRNLGCRVAMVTAVDPDFDIVDMAFEEYLVKPVSRADLRTVVDRLVLMAELEDVEYELGTLRVKRNVLRTEMRRDQLADSEEFARLEDRIETLRSRLTDLRSQLADARPDAVGVA